jgi:hypothetical protein
VAFLTYEPLQPAHCGSLAVGGRGSSNMLLFLFCQPILLRAASLSVSQGKTPSLTSVYGLSRSPPPPPPPVWRRDGRDQQYILTLLPPPLSSHRQLDLHHSRYVVVCDGQRRAANPVPPRGGRASLHTKYCVLRQVRPSFRPAVLLSILITTTTTVTFGALAKSRGGSQWTGCTLPCSPGGRSV